tara:strand:+ start:361 stop:594 length:234 start_codon:yes stop_codon:yes gene_type:complete
MSNELNLRALGWKVVLDELPTTGEDFWGLGISGVPQKLKRHEVLHPSAEGFDEWVNAWWWIAANPETDTPYGPIEVV